MTRILVVGCSGMLGSSFTSVAIRDGHTITGTYFKNPAYFHGAGTYRHDLRNFRAARNLIETYRPDWVVNCAALTDVDACETVDRQIVTEVNEDLPWYLAAACWEKRVGFVHISTDMVFDGRAGDYHETSAPNPINVYGQSKFKAEELIAAEMGDSPHIIARTTIYGWSRQKKSLAERIIHSPEFHGFEDVIFSPIFTDDLSRTLLKMMEEKIYGLYHVAGAEPISKYGFALQIASIFDLDKDRITPTSVDTVRLTAPRPKNLSLNVESVQAQLRTAMPDVDEGLQRMRKARLL